MPRPTLEELIGALRSALHYLYDPVQLRSSPLVAWLGLSEEADRAAVLRTQLMAAVRALKPADSEDPQSRAWRIYDLLHFRYIRQLSRDAVATQLGISLRQLRREQRTALEVLAQQLQHAPDPLFMAQPSSAKPPATELPATEPSAAVQPVTDYALQKELAWFRKGAHEEIMALKDALQMVRQLVHPLAERSQIDLHLDVPAELSGMPVPLPLLRNVLPTILSVAISRGQPTSIALVAAWVQSDLTISVVAHSKDGQGEDAHSEDASLAEGEVAALQTAEQLASFHHAQLEVPTRTATAFVAILTLPRPAQIKVLVIDDNPDWIELQQRYVSATRYQVIGSSDSLHAAELVVQVQPAVILLDVMIQAVDGWQILSELRHEPATAAIPVVICTILPVGELALALGADAFLQKPVSQEHYLAMLERWST